jgi:hypothetical protein
MKTHQAFLKRITQLGLLLMMGLSMSGCSSDMSWKEEVQLSDGRLIVVDRELLYESGGGELASNHSGSKPKAYLIRFEYPKGSGKMIEWRTTKKSPKTWPEIPLVFDMESQQPVVFAILGISPACEVYSKYVYRNGTWIDEPFPEQFSARTTNLFFGNGKDMPSLVNLEEKNKRNSGVGYRKALKQVGPSSKVCGD